MDDKQQGNTAFDWSQFDPEAYFSHYYADPHPDDERAVRLTCEAFARAHAPGASLDVVDVGTGPNLFPLLSALPRAASLTAWEYSAANTDWLRRELARPELRPAFARFWSVARETYPDGNALPLDPLTELRRRTSVCNGSIFDLPERRWDAATMFFCAESITRDRNEFEAACKRFAGSVRPGGALIAAFLAGSQGYDVAKRRFPAVAIDEGDIREVFGELSTDMRLQLVGFVEEEVRSGYSGMLFLSARAA